MRLSGLLAISLTALAVNVTTAQTTTELANQVRESERAFARTMAQRDVAAFGTFIGDEALFFGRTMLRGRTAVIEGWQRFFEGPTAPFSWEPETAEVLESGTLGITSGPVYDPQGKRVGTFMTIWQREADGKWRVIFDKGCP
jgi:ketosteroid isomerase-like protein